MKKLFPLFFLGAAFGVVEGAVVIYLRPLLNYGKEDFSLNIFNSEFLTATQRMLIQTEFLREAATIALIAAAAAAAAASFFYWAAYFVFTFAVWDLSYYVFLKIRLGWPASILDLDVLFLIPSPWLAPVLAPVLISLIGIGLSVLSVKTLDYCGRVSLRFYHWAPVLLALSLWIISFLNNGGQGAVVRHGSYSWFLFITGAILSIGSGALFYRDFLMRRKSWMFK